MSIVNAATALLQALVQGQGYGLELIERVKKQSKGKIVIGIGSVYPALRSLERQGFGRSWDGEPVPETAGRPRRYYEITADGMRIAGAERKAVAGLFGLPAEASP